MNLAPVYALLYPTGPESGTFLAFVDTAKNVVRKDTTIDEAWTFSLPQARTLARLHDAPMLARLDGIWAGPRTVANVFPAAPPRPQVVVQKPPEPPKPAKAA